MRTLSIVLLVFFHSQLVGQTLGQLQNLADDYYTSSKYREALDFYKHIHDLEPADHYVHFQYASCLFKTQKYEEALKEFDQLLSKGKFSDSVMYHLGLSLKILGRYHQADSVLGELLYTIEPENKHYKLAEFQQAGCQLGMRQVRIKNTRNFRLYGRLNSDAHDFGAVQDPATGRIVLATNRKTKQKQFYDGQYGGLLPNLVCFAPENTAEECVEFDALNSKWAEGTGSFSMDGERFYFSSCQKDESCKIMVSHRLAGQWSPPVALGSPINLSGTDSKHPSLCATGDTLFFCSNRAGGQGGLDIWMSIKFNKKDWSTAINLGETINTAADEIAPYYSSVYKALVFSSNGHAGYGGYDLYIARGNSFYSPGIYNVGRPFNSTFDDTYFSLGRSGFLSSNRNGTDFDIFRFDYKDEAELLNSFIAVESLVDLTRYQLTSLNLETFRVEDYEGYALFQPIRQPVVKENHLHMNIIGEGPSQSAVRLSIDENNEIATLVDEGGHFEFRLLPDTIRDYSVMINATVVPSQVIDTTYNYNVYTYETLYFDFGKHDLRDESRESLRDLISQFRPGNVALIDIHTHADAIGTHEYNFALSERRGFTVMRYLSELGLPYRQARVFANGEKKLSNTLDTWYGQLLNRRAELIVYTRNPVSITPATVYVVRRELTVEEAAGQLRIPSQKLMEWNGLSTNLLKVGHVLRVLDTKHHIPQLRYLMPEKLYGEKTYDHVVKKGETLRSIAEKYHMPEEVLYELNDIQRNVAPGDIITIVYEP